MSFLTDLRFQDPEGLVNRAAFNERFETLNRLNTRIGDEWVWAKKQYTHSIIYENEKTLQIAWASSTYRKIRYSDEVEIFEDDIHNVSVVLKAPITEIASITGDNYTDISVIGKYFQTANVNGGSYSVDVYLAKSNIAFAGGPYDSFNINASKLSVISDEETTYVNSPDPNAYPPAEPDGDTYTPLGQLGDKVRIATGEYTGTGTYGNDNPVTLTFPFEPILVLVVSTGPSVTYAFFVRNCNGYLIGSNSGEIGTRWDRNSIIWFSKVGQSQNMNASGYIYQYIALG